MNFLFSNLTWDLVTILSVLMIVTGLIVCAVLLSGQKASYGRYTEQSTLMVPATVSWVVQEGPSFFIPLYFLIYHTQNTYGALLLALFLVHYANRTFIYPFKLRTKNGTPWYISLSAIAFCCWNGYIQGAWNSQFQPSYTEVTVPWFFLSLLGILIFFKGMHMNIQADNILLNLREPGETGYKIPRGGMFEYVSGANYLGEIVEWTGYALAAQSLPAVAFAIFTICNIGPRAIHHHQWYLNKFKGEYPTERKALIPFIL
ncbi:unnamed protein product [Caenorhabditis auriculariae]|uniref:3-oxo-5alpha-steroid 4-dehydrogenase (NADP(+)) n=1 Tax=Caenorhabditis auriculariae TaxID=2777116 RepID=A0A8S1HL64_9PELO|nr:unnamed protein product [Caenorhabditis auriculariae]